MVNEELASKLYEIADLLDLDGERFKPEAYRRAARVLEQTVEDLELIRREHRLGSIPGIGEALTKKIEEYLDTGKIGYLDKLRTAHPSGVVKLMRLEGLGPKTARRLWLELGVASPTELIHAIDEGRLSGVKGFGTKRIAQFREAAIKGPNRERIGLPVAQAVADQLLKDLADTGVSYDRLTYAGSLRRRRETVGDLDLLATSPKPAALIDAFVKLPSVESVKMSGDTKATVLLKSGLQVDLRVVAPESFGAALQYFTGSKDHNIQIRTMALERNLSINEYGITRHGTLVRAKEEAEVYSVLDLPYIRPELRENSGEIEAAHSGELPDQPDSFLPSAELHIHTSGALEPWLEAGRNVGLDTLGFVLTPGAPDLGGARVSRSNGTPIHALRGWEVEASIQSSREIPWTEIDYLLLRPDASGALDLEVLDSTAISEHRVPAFIVHLEELRPSPNKIRWDLMSQASLGLEVGVMDDRVTCESSLVRKAVTSGVRIMISSRPLRTQDLRRIMLARDLAYRGWAGRQDFYDPSHTSLPG